MVSRSKWKGVYYSPHWRSLRRLTPRRWEGGGMPGAGKPQAPATHRDVEFGALAGAAKLLLQDGGEAQVQGLGAVPADMYGWQ